MTLSNTIHNTHILIDDLKATDDENGKFLNSDNYHAQMACESISKAIHLTTLKVKTSSDVSIQFKKTDSTPLRFLYCHKGDLLVQMNNRKRKLSSFQNAILFENKDSDMLLNLKSNKTYRFSIISVNKNLSIYSAEEANLLRKLIELITKGNYLQELCYISSRNLAVGMALKGLDDINGEKFGDKLILSGKIRVILGLEYQQLLKDLSSEENDSTLTKREMQRVSELVEKIKKNPGNHYSVSSLSMEAGLSENKLQEGFKELFDRTVTDCIRNIRLEKAEELLKTTDLNVSEVVYSVGFISRSYFSKIFKAKYKCSPSFYKKQRQVEEVA